MKEVTGTCGLFTEKARITYSGLKPVSDVDINIFSEVQCNKF